MSTLPLFALCSPAVDLALTPPPPLQAPRPSSNIHLSTSPLSRVCLSGDGEQDPQHTQRDLLQQNQRHCERPEVGDPAGEPRQARGAEERPGGRAVQTTPSPVKKNPPPCACVIVRVPHSGFIPAATELACCSPSCLCMWPMSVCVCVCGSLGTE